MFLRGIFHMATRGTFTSCQRRLHICWCANVLLLLVKEVFFPLWGGMRAIPTSTFAVFWRKANVKRALASVPPVTWKREWRSWLQHTKSEGQLYREKSEGKRKPRSWGQVLGSYLRRRYSGPPDISNARCRTWKNKQPFHTTAITTKTQPGRSFQRRTWLQLRAAQRKSCLQSSRGGRSDFAMTRPSAKSYVFISHGARKVITGQC